MGSNMAELRLDLNPGYEMKTVSCLLKEVSMARDSSEKLSKIGDYVKGLEDEMRKIDGFKRELPLCMLLLSDAILRLKEEATQCAEPEGRGHVTEEFIPLKGRSDDDGGAKMGKDSSDKRSWMSSAQLWSCSRSSDQPSVMDFKQRSEEDNSSGPENPVRLCKYGSRAGAFVPFKVSSGFPAKEEKPVSPVAGLSLMTPAVEVDPNCSNSKRGDSPGTGSSPASTLLTDSMRLQSSKSQQQPLPQGIRKQRRCWSPELHRRFVGALQQLGGSQAATPKQIRELMQVEGLTNDEVKSHLQKYRLHVRRIPSTSATAGGGGGGNGSWAPQVQCGDASKKNISQSGSPQGPLHLSGSAKGASGTGGDDSMEYDEDDKSEGHSWKDHHHHHHHHHQLIHKPGPGDDDV